MPLSYQYKIIFLHIAKNSGTSVCTWLNINESEENYYLQYYKYNNCCALQHMTYNQLKSSINEKIFNNYIKFTIVRNPWDKIVSTYEWRKKLNNNVDIKFKDFIKFIYKLYKTYDGLENLNNYPNFSTYFCAHFYPQYLYLPNDTSCNDFYLLRFENLNEDIKKIGSIINNHKKLPHINQSNNKNYQNYYDEESKKMIEEMYKKDIKIFNYSF